MHLFIPFFDTDRTERTLWDARRLVQPGDRVTVMVAVIVPANLPVDVDAGEIWARVCQAERRISHTREAAERILPHGVHLRCARIQARDMTSAILAGLANYQADLLMLTVPRRHPWRVRDARRHDPGGHTERAMQRAIRRGGNAVAAPFAGD